jgi:hypothetical protein
MREAVAIARLTFADMAVELDIQVFLEKHFRQGKSPVVCGRSWPCPFDPFS